MNKKSIVICLALAVAAWSLPARANYSSVVMAANPIAFWQFNDGPIGPISSGSTCVDTADSHNGIYNGDITLGPGPGTGGNGATFYGTSGGKGSFIDIPGGNTSGLEFTSGTLQLVVGGAPSANYGRILQHEDGSGNPYGWGIMGGLSNPNQIGIFGCDSTWYTPYGSQAVFDGHWHYIVVTYSYNSGSNITTESWYLDCTLEATHTVSGSLTYPGPSYADALMGAEGNPYYVYSGFVGTLADVAIYNYVLSPDQITTAQDQIALLGQPVGSIPEPATIALLSLSGLALLKRRAQGHKSTKA
jgi:hypothetical protein